MDFKKAYISILVLIKKKKILKQLNNSFKLKIHSNRSTKICLKRNIFLLRESDYFSSYLSYEIYNF